MTKLEQLLLKTTSQEDLAKKQAQAAEFIRKDKEKAAALLRAALTQLSNSEPTSTTKVRKEWI